MRGGFFCHYRSALLLIFVFLFATQTARAQLFTDEAARQQARENANQIDKITAALRALNESVSGLLEHKKNARRQTGELLPTIQGLEQQLRELRGRIDELHQQQKTE